MPETRDDMEAAAIGWVIRLRDARAEDWKEFVAWLNSDTRHRDVYEEVALADRVFDNDASSRASSNARVEKDGATARPRVRRMILGWAIAASLVGTLGYVSLGAGENLFTVRTAPGEQRSLTLADGSRVDLNGETILVLDRGRPRLARLEKGEALFTVVHDPERPFGVEAGGTYIKDLGTVFNVVVTGGGLEVAVAEGRVIFNPGREEVSLSPGMAIRTEGARASVSRGDVQAVGAWRSGRLSYDGASFSKIAEDISRNIGIPVRVDQRVANRRFSGVIVLSGDQNVLFRRVAGLLGVNARKTQDGGWYLLAASEIE